MATTTLREVLEPLDQIEDDAEFIEAEHDAAIEYFENHGYELSDDDMDTVESRGLYGDYEANKWLWEERMRKDGVE